MSFITRKLYPNSKHGKSISFFVLLLLLFGLSVSLYLATHQQYLRSKAANFSSAETESGVLLGSVSIGSDSQASGGQYVQFGSVSNSASTELISLISDVTTAKAYKYGLHDNLGNTMDTLKVITNPQGGYLGVYHTLINSVFYVKIATSMDLLNWTFKVDLDNHASQPTIAQATDASFVIAYEVDPGGPITCTGTGGSGNNCLKFKHFANISSLLSNSSDRTFQAARTLSNCAEGTPNVYSISLNPDIDHSTVNVGHHYFRNCDVDRQARGTLTNFNSWTTSVETSLNNLFESQTNPVIGGNIGDRDNISYKGGLFNIHEAQLVKGDFGSWRAYFYDLQQNSLTQLTVKTHKGSTSFANPAFTNLTDPFGKAAVAVTYFIPSEGAATGEGGELIFYKEY